MSAEQVKKWGEQLEKWLQSKLKQFDSDEEFKTKRIEQHGSREGFEAALRKKMNAQLKAKQNKAAGGDDANPHMRKKDATDEVAVDWQDQQRINEFGRLNVRLGEVEEAMKKLTRELASLNDAEQEIEMLLDDDACKIRIGEVYVNVSNDDAETFITEEKEEKTTDMTKHEAEVSGIKSKMGVLRVALKAKFGDAINLDTDKKGE